MKNKPKKQEKPEKIGVLSVDKSHLHITKCPHKLTGPKPLCYDFRKTSIACIDCYEVNTNCNCSIYEERLSKLNETKPKTV